MWVFTIDGFFSAVLSPEFCAPGEIAIRARSKEDLLKFVKWLEQKVLYQTKVIETPQADYSFRVIIPQKLWAQYLMTRAQEIDYSNFKGATTANDELRHDAYFGCWQSLWDWQQKLKREEQSNFDEMDGTPDEFEPMDDLVESEPFEVDAVMGGSDLRQSTEKDNVLFFDDDDSDSEDDSRPVYSDVERTKFCVNVLKMVGVLHAEGYQKLRICPALSPSGMSWRCLITTASNMKSDNGALIDNQEIDCLIYSSAQENRYFGWEDSTEDEPHGMAQKFLVRFPEIAEKGKGLDEPYSRWFQELLSQVDADSGNLPMALSDYFVSSKTGGYLLLGASMHSPKFPLPPLPQGD